MQPHTYRPEPWETSKPLENYPGAKNGAGVWQKIISAMPPHRVYVEPFLGTGAVLRRKRPAATSLAIDKSEAVIEAFKPALYPGCLAICGDGLHFLESNRLDSQTLVYCDPPYLKSARKSQADIYAHEWDELAHIRFLRILRHTCARVIVSGYWSELYADGLKDWRTLQFWTTNRAGDRVQEWLWMNFPEPFELHDYRFLGADFRERERIKRKKARWKERLLKMPAAERGAILEAIAEARTADATKG